MGSSFFDRFAEVSAPEVAYDLFEKLQSECRFKLPGKDISSFLNDKKLWTMVDDQHRSNCGRFERALSEMGIYYLLVSSDRIEELMLKEGLWYIVEEKCSEIKSLTNKSKRLSSKLEELPPQKPENEVERSEKPLYPPNDDLSDEETDESDPESIEVYAGDMEQCRRKLCEVKQELEQMLPAAQFLCSYILKCKAFKKYGAPEFDYSILNLPVEEEAEQDSSEEEEDEQGSEMEEDGSLEGEKDSKSQSASQPSQ
ncbi:hypothetical protein BCV70DRAFT_78569 [Testicularia cyperi]|uniref:Uncharacterized protein n=1 Tax=Testicularia cyperi TaxID=1882483 RepID=A0A317XTT2_9BASI|nr:hypothetical protein BCV70DRAFT_78569 [Testicularia cyperi]